MREIFRPSYSSTWAQDDHHLGIASEIGKKVVPIINIKSIYLC